MDNEKKSTVNKLEMFSFEWWQHKGEANYKTFLIENKLSAVSDFERNEYYKIFLNEELKRINQNLSDKRPNGKPKGNNLLSSPHYKVELLKYHDYILNEIPIKEPRQETKKEKRENPYPEIFKRNGFDVFEKIHADYKDKDNSTANYSFLFYAMKNDDGLIHCGGTEFIEFLALNYNIQIDRIDSRQSGQNKRTGFYNVIKAQ